MPSTRLLSTSLLAMVAALVTTVASSRADDASGWTEKDSRLANQYISLLQQDPSYGQPVDLLWDLYSKNNATDLLLEHFSTQSANPVARLVHGHLLRKSGDLEAAMAAYDDALAAVPDSRHALDAKADLAVALDQIPTALDTLDRITALLPTSGPNTSDHHLRIATFHANNGDHEAAAASLSRAVDASPDDPARRKRIADSYLGIGDLTGAIAQFDYLATTSDPETKVNALAELARLHELAGDLTAAAAALEAGMAATHFKHHLHREFFRRLVRLHEREGNLDTLRDQLAATATAGPPSEQALLAAASFARLTVDPESTLLWQEKLHAAFPGDPVYHLDLATALIDNDRLEEAATTLDSLIAKSPAQNQPLPLTLARCEVDAKLGNRTGASQRLAGALARHRGDRTSESTILDFATTHFIDSVALEILENRARRNPSEAEHTFTLARFHLERGNATSASEAIDRFIAAGSPATPRLSARLRQAADFFVAQDRPDTAQPYAARAAEIGSDDPDSLLQLAEIAFARGDLPLAISHIEQALEKTRDPAGRIALDSRILSYLQHNFHKQTSAGDDAAFRIGSLLAPQPAAPASETGDARTRNYAAATLDYAAGRALEAGANPTTENLFRATWWAFRTDDFPGSFRHLRQLLQQNPEAELHTAKLTLEIASSSSLYALTKRQLQHLVELDPENATTYVVRLADLEVAPPPVGPEMPARAIALLEPLVGAGELDTKVVESLARAYAANGQPSEATALWERSFNAAPDPATRATLLGPLAAEYLSRQRTPDAVDAYSRVIREQRDDKKRRELFAQQLSLASGNVADAVLEQLATLYRSLQSSDPLEPFWNEALARTLAKAGETAEAFAAMKRAYYNDPDPDPGTLTELREMALGLGDRTAALYFQRQLIFTAGSGAGPDEWQKLVSMLEERLDVDATDRARQRLERRFGQDTDLLAGILDHYEKSGQHASALRVASQLADLRPWDAATQFRLGLLHRAAGHTRQAFDAFAAAVEQSPTDDALDPGDTPIVEIPHAAILASTVQNDQFLTESESHRTITLLSKIAQDTKTANAIAVPTGPTQLQLAAIAAAAPLAAELGGETLESWQSTWQSQAAAQPHAAYRALAGSGATRQAAAIARDNLLPLETEESYLRYAYALVSLRCWDDLAAWLGEPDTTVLHRANRLRFSSFVIAGMLRSSTPESPSAADIKTLAATGFFGPPDLWTFAVSAAAGRHYAKATSIAALVDSSPQELHPTQAYTAAYWSHWAGKDETGAELLRAHFDSPADRPSHPNWFFKAFEQLEHQTHDPSDREVITHNAIAIAAAHAATINHSYTAPPAFVDPASLVQQLAGAPTPTPRVPSPTAYRSQFQFWREAEQATNLFATHRLGELASSTADAVLDAVVSPPDPDDDNYGHFLTFSANTLAAKLRHKHPLEQSRLVGEALAAPLTPEELYDLATILSNRGYPRHAATVLVRLIELDPSENTYVNDLSRACYDASDPTPALGYFNRVLVSRTLPTPKRTPPAFLANNYAAFLRMAGDADSLATFASAAPQVPLAPEQPTVKELPYIVALARLHLDNGDHAAAIPVLHTALGIDPDSTAVITDLAAALNATGDYAATLELLEAPPARNSVLPADRSKILTARATALAALGQPDELLPLLVEATELALATPLVEIANTAAQAGQVTAATSALELARRASTDNADRSDYAAAALTLTLSSSATTTPRTLADRLAPPLETTSPSLQDLESLLDTVETNAARLAPAWEILAAAGTLQHSRTNRALAALVHLAIGGDADIAALAGPGTTTTILHVAVHRLIDTGRHPQAASLLAAASAPGSPPRRTAPMQVAIAAAAGDELTLRTLYATAAHEKNRSSRIGIKIPAAFAEAGMPRRALDLYQILWTELLDTMELTLRQTYDNPSRRSSFVADVVATFTGYARLLIAEKRYTEAAALIPYTTGLSPASTAEITAELHTALGTSPENFLAATAPLGLTPGISLHAARLHAESHTQPSP